MYTPSSKLRWDFFFNVITFRDTFYTLDKYSNVCSNSPSKYIFSITHTYIGVKSHCIFSNASECQSQCHACSSSKCTIQAMPCADSGGLLGEEVEASTRHAWPTDNRFGDRGARAVSRASIHRQYFLPRRNSWRRAWAPILRTQHAVVYKPYSVQTCSQLTCSGIAINSSYFYILNSRVEFSCILYIYMTGSGLECILMLQFKQTFLSCGIHI